MHFHAQVSYIASADLNFRKPCGMRETLRPRLTACSVTLVSIRPCGHISQWTYAPKASGAPSIPMARSLRFYGAA